MFIGESLNIGGPSYSMRSYSEPCRNLGIGSKKYCTGVATAISLNEETYDHPIITKELDDKMIMLYEAWGIPKENICYDTEFINKTKQTYLNVNGCAELMDLGFENDINIHILIDTDIYDGYEVNVNDGMVMVVLHEIKNESPNLKDFGREKFIKSCE